LCKEFKLYHTACSLPAPAAILLTTVLHFKGTGG